MRTAAFVLLLALCARADDVHSGWFLVNNSGAASMKKEKAGVRIERPRGNGMDLLRANLSKAPAPGQKFLLKAKFKAKGVGNGWFKIFFYDAKGESLGQGRDVKSLRGDYDWKEFVLDQKAPEGTAAAAIMVLLVQPGTLWVDDVRIEIQGEKARRPLDKKLSKWLDRNATEVRTLSIEGDMRDLAAFAKQLRGVRVVQLGENTHGDGAAFAAKCRLIRWLHEKMGFDVVAFESGLYECDRATRMLKPGADPEAVMRASVFPIWHTKQARPLFEYLIAQSATRRPMALTGFDLRMSGEGAKNLVPDVLSALKAIGVSPSVQPGEESLLALFRKQREALVEKHGAREVAFLDRCLKLRIAGRAFEKLAGDERTAVRDRSMAKTLVWLAQQRYPKAKIVCWAATAHQAHGLDGIRRGGKPMYDGPTMAGVHAKNALGNKLYTVGFIAHGGAAGMWHRGPFPVPQPADDSVEALLYRYGKPYLLVPLGSAPFEWPTHMAPMTYLRNLKANWSKVVDAVFYIDEMEPAAGLR